MKLYFTYVLYDRFKFVFVNCLFERHITFYLLLHKIYFLFSIHIFLFLCFFFHTFFLSIFFYFFSIYFSNFFFFMLFFSKFFSRKVFILHLYTRLLSSNFFYDFFYFFGEGITQDFKQISFLFSGEICSVLFIFLVLFSFSFSNF